MKLKNILKTTALFTLIMGFSLSSFADTPKMYGIQGDSLSIKTTIPTPQSYEAVSYTHLDVYKRQTETWLTTRLKPENFKVR